MRFSCAVGERRFNQTPWASKRRSGSPSVPGIATTTPAGARSHSDWSPSTTFAAIPGMPPVMCAVKSVATGSVLPTWADATPGTAAAIPRTQRTAALRLTCGTLLAAEEGGQPCSE